MADVYTTTQTGSVDVVQAAYDRLMYFSLRPELYFDQICDVQPTAQSMPGNTVTFTIQADMAIATTPLNESVDVSAVAISASQATVTLVEYGNAVITTALLRGESFVDYDPVVGNVVGYNAGVSIDSVARTVLQAGTNVDYSQVTTSGATARNQILPANIISSAQFRAENARLRTNNVANFGGFYAAIVHPNVAYDLRGEAGDVGWRDPHVYSQPGEIWSGELGAYEGFRFIETPRAPVFATGGSQSTPVYGTLCLGRQSLAKAHSIVDGNGPTPHIVPGPVTDHLRRFVPWGWYWLGGYSIFRQASVRRIESASSLAFVDVAIDD